MFNMADVFDPYAQGAPGAGFGPVDWSWMLGGQYRPSLNPSMGLMAPNANPFGISFGPGPQPQPPGGVLAPPTPQMPPQPPMQPPIPPIAPPTPPVLPPVPGQGGGGLGGTGGGGPAQPGGTGFKGGGEKGGRMRSVPPIGLGGRY